MRSAALLCSNTIPHQIEGCLHWISETKWRKRIQQNDFDGLKVGSGGFVSSWGKEQYIALKNENGDNYSGNGNTPTFTVPSSKTEQESSSTQQVDLSKESQGLG